MTDDRSFTGADEPGEAEALRVLARGGVVAAATETLFALLADARHPDAVTRVFDLKHRDFGKGVALLLPNRAAWADWVAAIPAEADRLATAFWPGPLTIALPAQAVVDPRLVVNATIGVRWPASSAAGKIAAAYGSALTATSCNVVGQPACATSDEVRRAFSAVLQNGDLHLVEGVAPGGAPSTIVSVHGYGFTIMRHGVIAERDIERVMAGGA